MQNHPRSCFALSPFAWVLCVLCTALSCQAADHNHTLRCAIAEGFAPYQFRDDMQQAQGFDADFARLLSQRLNIPITLQVLEWRQAYFQLRAGRLDCIVGMEITPDRQKTFLFSAPYYVRYSSIFALSNRHDLNKPTDLIGMRVSTDPQSEAEELLHKSGLSSQLTLLRPANKTLAAQMLVNQQSDAMIAPFTVGYFLAKELQQSFKTLYIDPQGLPVAIALNPKQQDLLIPLNRALAELQNDTTFLQLKQRWQLLSPDTPPTAP